MLNSDLKTWLAKYFGECVKFDEPMSRHTYLRIGGPAEAFVIPEDLEKLLKVVRWSKEKNIPCMVIGSGANLLVRDRGINGIVVILKKCLNNIVIKTIKEDSVIVEAMAGASLQSLCSFAIDNGLKGMNFALGIPGTVGGAIMMNAGTAYGSTGDVIDSIKGLLPDGRTEIILKQDLCFDYRRLSLDTAEKDNSIKPIVLSGFFSLAPSNRQIMKEQATEILKERKKNQPSGFPSAGCFFKNPSFGKTAGELIDLAGLKGTSFKDAEISSKHANFFLNKGNASAADMIALMELAQKKVWGSFNIKLEAEIKIIGE